MTCLENKLAKLMRLERTEQQLAIKVIYGCPTDSETRMLRLTELAIEDVKKDIRLLSKAPTEYARLA